VSEIKTAQHWINKLNLIKHPTAGYYAEMYRSVVNVILPDTQIRSAHTAIYYLLSSDEIGHWRRLKSDETFHFYSGEDLLIHLINTKGELSLLRLGHSEIATLQFTIPAGTWFALEVAKPQAYSLVACCVTPGFDYADYEILSKRFMLKTFPQHADILQRLGSDYAA